MKGEVTSLLLNDASILVLVTSGGEIQKWARMSLEEGQVSDGVVKDSAAVAAKVSELFRDLRLNNTKVSVGLSGVNSVARVISLPPMPEGMIGNHIKAKLGKDLSVPLDTLCFFWQTVESTENEIRVFSIAYPRNTIDSMLNTLHQAGITAISLELAPLALARVAGKATAVVVDVRSFEVDIVVLSNRVPEIVTSIILPRDRSLRDNVPVIQEALNRIISFYTAENNLRNELAVILLGDVAAEPDLYTTLSRDQGYSVIPFSPLFKYPESMEADRYATNIGLALKEASVGLELSSFVNLNMMPEISRPGSSLWTRVRTWPRRLASSISAMVTRPVTTIYVEDNKLRLMVTKGLKVVKWGKIDLEPGLVSDGVVEDPAAVAQKVLELFTKHDVKRGKVVVGVTGLHSLHRTIVFPRLSKSELAEAVKRDSQRELPVPLSDLYLSWQVIDTSREETKVFSIAYPKKLADGLVDMLRRAGITAQLMDLASMAISRATGSVTNVAVDVRDVEVDITVLTQGVPEVLRTIRFPTGRTAGDRLSLVKEELRRTLDFYKARNPSHSALPVFLSGEIDMDPDIYLSWSKELGCPVLPPAPPIYYPDDMPVVSYMTNIGLSLKKSSVSADHITLVNLNALPDIYRQRQIPWGKAIAPAAGILGLVLIAYGGFLVWDKTSDINLLNSQIADTSVEAVLSETLQRSQEQQIAELEERVSEASRSREIVADAYEMIVNLQQTLKDDIELAVYSLQDRVTLTSMSHSGDILVVTGGARTEQQVFEYARTLDMSSRFSEIVVTGIRQNSEQGVDFTLTFQRRD
ncbi:MAG TPA: pilus assembly protein PilM [Dehalococcoidia bacterium]|nr:pilus assembly protein PilM [Dehalococcoidia bacterium]